MGKRFLTVLGIMCSSTGIMLLLLQQEIGLAVFLILWTALTPIMVDEERSETNVSKSKHPKKDNERAV